MDSGSTIKMSNRTLNLLEIIYLQCLCKLIKYILSIKDKTCLILQIGVNKKYKKKDATEIKNSL